MFTVHIRNRYTYVRIRKDFWSNRIEQTGIITELGYEFNVITDNASLDTAATM